MHEKKNIVKVSLREDLRGRVDKDTKVVFLEDEYLLKELYDIRFEFKVEICLDVRDAGLTIWLESPELQEAIINGRKKLVDDNIDCFRQEFVVIEQ